MNKPSRQKEKETSKKFVKLSSKKPQTTTNELVFEPDEAEEMHRGTVGMMKGNKNISVLLLCRCRFHCLKTSADSASNNLEKMMQNIYYEASASSR